MDGPEPVFASHAKEYAARGISIIPTLGPDGKRPAETGFMGYAKKQAHTKTIERWIKDRPCANIGIMAGPVSNLTVVDVDDPKLIPRAIEEFGDTPVIDRSPSRGGHLYFCYSGEKTTNRLNGEKIDIRAGAGNPLLIGPPSKRPFTQDRYEFVRGGIDDLTNLPAVKPGTIPLVSNAPANDRQPQKKKPWAEMVDGDGRNNGIFKRTLWLLKSHPRDEVIDRALEANQIFAEPLPIDEALQTIRGAIDRYGSGPRNWLGRKAHASATASEMDALHGKEKAFFLLMRLQIAHSWRNGDPFVLANAFADSLGWSAPTFRNARKALADTGFLQCVHPGGNGPHDPPVYRLRTKV